MAEREGFPSTPHASRSSLRVNFSSLSSQIIVLRKRDTILIVAEREGFEPSNPFGGLRDFESRAFDHSAISPCQRKGV